MSQSRFHFLHRPVLATLAFATLSVATAADGQKVKDTIWIWGHPAGALNESYLRPSGLASTIEPFPAARYMGIRNMLYVCYQGKPKPPFEEYYAPLRQLDRVYWSLVAAEGASSHTTREAAFALAEKNENIVGWILDDFFRDPPDGKVDDSSPMQASLTVDDLKSLRSRKVRGQQLPMMAVIYDRQLVPGTRAHIDELDQLCFWTSRSADLKNLGANFATLEKLAPGKQLFLGCYTYDFDARRPLPVELMRQQVELGYQWLKTRRIVGMIFLATANVDVDLEAVEWTRQWIQQNGNEVIPVPAK